MKSFESFMIFYLYIVEQLIVLSLDFEMYPWTFQLLETYISLYISLWLHVIYFTQILRL